ncbi:MAG: cytochrome c3 family protein [Bryobacterales bacterium]|nr:cytochrome c3 family protein [Bryobacterales bacterium]
MQWILTLAALFFAPQVSRTPPKDVPFTPGAPVVQPVPFSHKTHAGAAKLKCLACHAIEAPGDYAGFPAESKCMACHVAIKPDSPHIRQVAAAAAKPSGEPIEWKRVYRLKEFVYFSHEIHVRKAKTECAVCHGDVAAREVLHQEKSISMYACMRCHEERRAPNDCARCHDTH